MVKTTYDENKDDDDDEEGDDDEYITEENARSFGGNSMAESLEGGDLDLDDFESSMNKMSITPKNPLLYGMGDGLTSSTQMPARIRPSTTLGNVRAWVKLSTGHGGVL
ncbi:hypothetical protein ACLOJK_015659 [Asimina triloba]